MHKKYLNLYFFDYNPYLVKAVHYFAYLAILIRSLFKQNAFGQFLYLLTLSEIMPSINQPKITQIKVIFDIRLLCDLHSASIHIISTNIITTA